jgi:uncharacterized membrane protein (DUF4010 family)
VVSPALLGRLAPALAAALVAGVAVLAASMRRGEAGEPPQPPAVSNPAEMGTALRFAALYATVLFVSAWLSDLAGSRGLYAAAGASGLVDIDAITLSALNLFGDGRVAARTATLAIWLAFAANVVFKLAVLFWYDRRLAWRTLWPLAAAMAAGGAVLAFA